MEIDNSELNEPRVRRMLIKDMDADARPREKALKYGLDELSDSELMALIFSTGIKGKSVIDMCREILASNNNSLWALTNMSIQELCNKFKGIGVAKAMTLMAGLTLGKRAAAERDNMLSSEAVSHSEKAYYLMRDRFIGLQHEEFWIMLLNRAGKMVSTVQISRGGTAATTIDVKIILKAAISNLASSMILFHNHPSGTLKPSIEDDRLTKKIIDAARMIDVTVNDHIIVTDASYYSYSDNGRI